MDCATVQAKLEDSGSRASDLARQMLRLQVISYTLYNAALSVWRSMSSHLHSAHYLEFLPGAVVNQHQATLGMSEATSNML